MDDIQINIGRIRERIAAAAQRASRAPEEVRLVAVTKTHPPEVAAEALAAGLADFGENRVQEAEEKITALSVERPRITWHLIGHLQSNKAKRAAALFDMIHSVDSLRLAEAISKGRAHEGGESITPIPVLLQVNVSGESSKEGFDLAGWQERSQLLDTFVTEVEQILALPNIKVQGLMTIAPWGTNPEEARPTFRSARLLRDILAQRVPAGSWTDLSMGMTDDFEVAIEEGATIVRVGRAIFGARG